jgi:hypothetical protein
MQWRGLPTLQKEPDLKTALALLAVLVLAACASGTPAGFPGAPVKSDAGTTLMDSQGAPVSIGKF